MDWYEFTSYTWMFWLYVPVRGGVGRVIRHRKQNSLLMENCVLRKWKARKNSNLQDIVHENDVPLLWRQVDMVAVLALG